YTLVAVFIGAKVIDFMQEGAYAAKGATIISDKNDEIAAKILSVMVRGATFLKAVGSYTKVERNVLFLVVAKNEIVKLKNIITS
ncbi:YitT family protein, partial [Klebsiella pneumoniae]|nr:YitT family protein [Klebsiella pneumoniae]